MELGVVSVSVSEISDSHNHDYADLWFRVLTPCSLINIYRCFEDTFCLHHQDPEDRPHSSTTSSNGYHTVRGHVLSLVHVC
jgi:hypothetical protein